MYNLLEQIKEAKDITIYKRLIRVLGEYSQNVPATGIDELFNSAVEKGSKILPKDKRALKIIDYILSAESTAKTVHRLLNIRFSDLPTELKPVVKIGRKHKVASWARDSMVSDRVKSLIDFEGTGKKGRWVDIDGEKVSLIDTA